MELPASDGPGGPLAEIGSAPAERPPAGRWLKGQSGNPAGRPSRARQAAVVAEALISRNTVALTKTLLDLALGGDRVALRLCMERIAPARREPPVSLGLPPIVDRAGIVSAMTAVADAAARGAISAAQGSTLVQMLYEVYCRL